MFNGSTSPLQIQEVTPVKRPQRGSNDLQGFIVISVHSIVRKWLVSIETPQITGQRLLLQA